MQPRLLKKWAVHGSAFEFSIMVLVCQQRNANAFLNPFMHAPMGTASASLFAKELSMRIRGGSGLKRQMNTKQKFFLEDKLPVLSLLVLALPLHSQLTHILGEGCLST